MNKFISRFRFRLSRPFSCYSHSLPSSSNFRFLTLTARELHGSHHRLFDRELLITRSGEGDGGRGKKKEKRKRGKKRKRSKKEMVRRKRTKGERRGSKMRREGEDVYQSEQCLAHASLLAPETSPITLEQDLSRSPCQPPSPIRFGYTTLR